MSAGQSGYVSLQGGKLHYIKMGTGSRLLIAFHGYANNASLFYPFRRYLERDFTIISIDLPHHGNSVWPDEQLLHRRDLKLLVTQLMEEYKVERVALMGYSMGGRVSLKITELMPEKIDRVLLIASDGLVFNPLYYFVTRTFFGKKLFTNFLARTERYLGVISWLRKKEFIDASRHRFAMYYLESEKDRSFLLKVWPGMSELIPNMRRLRVAIRKHHIPIYIFMGTHDRIIPVPHAHRFKKDMESVHLFIVDKGHRVFDTDTLPQMANCLITGKC
jgi:pimeloyl-ACP methyl ester carboxylesterase